jgi:hypothetical protein
VPPPKKTPRQLDVEIAHVVAASRGSLIYRAIGTDSERWPAWIHAFQTSCGVYAIRDKGSQSVLYVGSSNGRLYDTVTRHFQQWKRNKRWWSGAYGAGHDPGLVYSRARCEVAIRIVSCDRLLEEEGRLIERFEPRDNLVEHPQGELEEAPF